MPALVLHASLRMMGGFAELGCGPLRSWGERRARANLSECLHSMEWAIEAASLLRSDAEEQTVT
jgi:hypothetical protein